MTKINEPTWWAGSNDEWFTEGPFDTREEALAEGRAYAEDHELEGFFIAEARTQEIRFSAKRLIEDQYMELEDAFDFDNGNEPDRLKGAEEADAELQALLDAWCEKHKGTFVQPGVFASCKTEWISVEG